MIPYINWNLPDCKTSEFRAELNLDVQLSDFISRRKRLADRLSGLVMMKNSIVGAHKEREEEIPFYLQNYFNESADCAASAELLLRDFERVVEDLKASSFALVSLCNASMEAKEKDMREREVMAEAAVFEAEEKREREKARIREELGQKVADTESIMQNKFLVAQDEIGELKAEVRKWKNRYAKKGKGGK